MAGYVAPPLTIDYINVGHTYLATLRDGVTIDDEVLPPNTEVTITSIPNRYLMYAQYLDPEGRVQDIRLYVNSVILRSMDKPRIPIPGEIIVPFDSLVVGERYLITNLRPDNNGVMVARNVNGRIIQDIPGVVLEKSRAGPENQVKFKLDTEELPSYVPATFAVFKSLKPNSVAAVGSLERSGLPTIPGTGFMNNILGFAGLPQQRKPDGSLGGRRRRKTRKSKKRSRKTRRR